MTSTKKERIIIDTVTRLIPNVTIKPYRAFDKDGVNYARFFIPPQNKYLSNSEYLYSEKLNFIHFTNLFALQSIITDRNLRLYNLHNLNDPREYSYAGDMLTFNDENKKDAKDNFYLLSMCRTNLVTSRKTTDTEFNMWRLYGNNGHGIAIELNFDESPPIHWNDYFLSEVYYGTTSRTKLKELNKLLLELESEIPTVRVDLGQIVCFHKSRLFKLEQEIRLLFDSRKMNINQLTTCISNGEVISPITKTDISKSSIAENEIKYLELPIYHTKFKAISKEGAIPIPKIERIILGYQFQKNFEKVATHLKDLCEKRLGYLPKIEKSRLTKWYHDRK